MSKRPLPPGGTLAAIKTKASNLRNLVIKTIKSTICEFQSYKILSNVKYQASNSSEKGFILLLRPHNQGKANYLQLASNKLETPITKGVPKDTISHCSEKVQNIVVYLHVRALSDYQRNGHCSQRSQIEPEYQQIESNFITCTFSLFPKQDT